MLEEHWGAPKDKQFTLIKRSYNALFSAVLKDGQKVVIRTTIENLDDAEKRLKQEMYFVDYLNKTIRVAPYV